MLSQPIDEGRYIVQHVAPPCQLPRPRTGDSRAISLPSGDLPRQELPHDTHTPSTEIEQSYEYSAQQVALAHGAAQEVASTASRRSGPRRWLRAVRWLIAAGLHGRANATTLAIAEDLGARMDYDTGHARYCLDELAGRLGVSRATVKRHVAVLRELGALAWVVHGTKTNIRRALGMKGYAATATVYAAVIPPAYDHAMGHRIVGSGYEARIIVDQRSQAKPVDNPPVDNPGSETREPPSLTLVKEESQVQMVGGFNYTSRKRASRDLASPLPQQEKKSSSNSTGRHALQVAEDIRITRLVRALVNWTQREGLRRLAYSLRPLIDCGLDSYAIAEFLHGMCSGTRWTPAAPAAYIRTVLADREETARRAADAQARYEEQNPTVGAFQATVSTQIDVAAAIRQGLDHYRRAAAAYGWDDLSGGETTTWNAEADVLAFLNGSPA